MSKPKAKPARIHYDAIPWGGVEGSSENLRIRRLITRGRQGSELMLGVASLDAGVETGWWSSMPEDEAGRANTGWDPSRKPTIALVAS